MPDRLEKGVKIGAHRKRDEEQAKNATSEQLAALGGMEGQVTTALSSFSPKMEDDSASRKKGFFQEVGGTVGAPFQSMKRKHERAVDQLNNSRGDFSAMGRLDRLKWAAQNPLAYTLASKEKEGTSKRNARNAELQKRVAAGRVDRQQTEVQRAYQGQLSHYRKSVGKEVSEDVDKAFGYEAKGTKGAGSLLEKFAGEFGDTADASMNGTMSLITGGKKTFDTIKAARDAGAVGNRTKQVTKGMDAGESLVSTLANGTAASLKIASKFKGLSGLNGVADKFTPGLDVLSGGVKAGKGVVNMVDATKARMNMSEQLAQLQTAGKDAKSEEAQIIRQIRSQAKIDQTGAGFDIATGSMKAAGGILKLSGAGATGSAVLSGAAEVGDFAKDKVVGKMGKSMRHQVLNEAFNLDGEIEALKKQYPDLSEREAKHVALQQKGYSTGKRKEAFQHLTMGRASGLTRKAVQATEEGKMSRNIIEGTGLKKGKTGQYDLQSVSEKLGMDKDKPWQEQMQEVAESRLANPFEKKAVAERKSKAVKAATQLAKKKGETSA